MTPEDLQTIKDDIRDTIKVTVNGKIDALAKQVTENKDAHTETRAILEAHIVAMEPVIEGVKFINTSRRFLIYIGAPVSILVGAILAIKAWWS